MEHRPAAWAVASPLVGSKLWVTPLLLSVEPGRQALTAVLATGWPWLVVALAWLAATLIGRWAPTPCSGSA